MSKANLIMLQFLNMINKKIKVSNKSAENTCARINLQKGMGT